MTKAQMDVEGRENQPKPGETAKNTPAEGPHARPELTDEEKTPGAGALVDKDSEGGDADGGVG